MDRPNVLLVVLDATRQDACSCYGNPARTTSALDALAREGTLFENAFTVAPWTFPSLSCLFTGLYPSQNLVYVDKKLASGYPRLPSLLSENGYSTFAISDNPWMSAEFGLTIGFDKVHKLWQWLQTDHDINNITLSDVKGVGRWRATAQLALQGDVAKNILNLGYYRLVRPHLDYGASRTLRPLASWIQSQSGPWFAFVHYLEAHMNYRPPRAWRERFVSDRQLGEELAQVDHWRLARRHIAGVEKLSGTELKVLRELYIAEVAYADHHLGKLIDWLRQTKRLDNTLVIVLADHGESLGEHDMLEHQYSLYDSLLRIPLVIRFPRLFPAGQRTIAQVQSIDLFATILDAAHIPMPEVPSQSVLPNKHQPRTRTYAEYGVPRSPHPSWLKRFGLQPEDLAPFKRGFTSIRNQTYKLIVGTDRSMQLYNWHEDPNEEHNLVDREPEVLEELIGELEAWWQKFGSGLAGDPTKTSIISPQVEERLRALGYID